MIKWENYLRNVGQKFVSILQEREITGNGMPLRSFNATIKYVQNFNFNWTQCKRKLNKQTKNCVTSQTLYDIKTIGIAKFHSGFIAKIDSSGILSTSYRSAVLEAYVNQSFCSEHSSFSFQLFSFRNFLLEQCHLFSDIWWSTNSLWCWLWIRRL